MSLLLLTLLLGRSDFCGGSFNDNLHTIEYQMTVSDYEEAKDTCELIRSQNKERLEKFGLK